MPLIMFAALAQIDATNSNSSANPVRIPVRDNSGNSTRSRAVIKKKFFVSVHQDKEWFIAQALGIDIASQGETIEESLENLKEALELHFEPPTAISHPQIREIEVEVMAG